jgi:mRNA-degrading endonuclease toxin of MazEF toxin-antitoxin module
MYQRGDVVVCVLSGDYGKPRPAVVVQSDVFNPTHASVTVSGNDPYRRCAFIPAFNRAIC